jgi:flavin reductase (DIM6/NTAB) family NADH-FMN oxidoreductase RutF
MANTATPGVARAATWSGVGDTAFRDLMNVFPSGVTVVTTQDKDGTPYGLTCTSMCSVSLRPPILLACLHNHSQTLSTVLRQGAFAINLLHDGGQDAAEVFATANLDRFAEVEWDRTPKHGLPWLTSDAHAVAECTVVQAMVAGDHVVVFGEVQAVHSQPQTPLLYGLRSYSSWAADDCA